MTRAYTEQHQAFMGVGVLVLIQVIVLLYCFVVVFGILFAQGWRPGYIIACLSG